MSEPIRVVIDFASPAAYLAVEPIRALEARLGHAFEWLPFTVTPLKRPTPARPDDDRGTRHTRIRAEYLARDLHRYAKSRGLELGDLYRERDGSSAALGLLWLRRRAPALAGDYATRVFDRIWREDAVADLSFVERLLGNEAAGVRAYAEDDAPRELAALRAELATTVGWIVPAFLVGDEVFLGRQHLPIVEWLATGRAGPPPI
jgi:2-hydroxychromene-2-carboxylate isomerase